MGNQLGNDSEDKNVNVEPNNELENDNECSICRYPTETYNEFEKHMKKHYFTKHYCLSCYNMYETERKFQEHFQNNYHLRLKCDVYFCKFCLKEFVAKLNLMQHLQLCHFRAIKDRSKIHKASKGIQVDNNLN